MSQPCPGLHQKQHVWNVKGGDSAPLLHSAEAPPGEQWRTWTCWKNPDKGHEDDERVGASLLWRQAKRAGIVQPGKRGLWGAHTAPASTWRGPIRKLDRDFLQEREGTGQGTTALNWYRVGLDQILGITYLLWGRWDSATGWPSSSCGAVPAASLEVFKAKRDGAWSNLVYWEVSLPMAAG